MYRLKSMGAALAASLLVASTAAAQLETPGSVLVYPTHRSGNPAAPATQAVLASFSILSVTNVNVDDATDVKFNYVNTVPNLSDPHLPLDCYVVDRVEYLTPADTLSVLTTCHNAAVAEGYVVISAQNPMVFDGNWSFNHLVGSEMVITSSGLRYSINAIPFSSPQNQGADTDLDLDGQLDFDGTEYECIPDLLYIDSFLALAGSSLTLLNLTGGTPFTSLVAFSVWNDNEQALSATRIFRCWFEQPLTDVSNVFSEYFLANNTPHDASELDVDCDDVGDLETGWAIIEGLVTSSTLESVPNPALLGAITNGTAAVIEGGRVLWGSRATQCNGDFLKFGVDDPEYPEPLLPPVCDAGGPYASNQGDVVFFDGSGSTDPDGMITRYDWDFGDGNGELDGGAMPSHTYFSFGDYSVTLTVTDDEGLVTTCASEVRVNAPPICNVDSVPSVMLGDTILFDGSGSSDPDGTVSRYDWDFGDGTLLQDGGATPVHTYLSFGVFTVTLVVTDDDGSSQSCTIQINVNAPPECDAGPSLSGDVGDILTFDASGSMDPDGTIVRFDWDFGDGTGTFTSGGPLASHFYMAGGIYIVTLTVTDDNGSTATCTTTAEINDFPDCDAGPSQSGNAGDTFTFDGSNTTDPDGDDSLIQYDWSFGDGTPTETDAGAMPSHVYAAAGTYTVTLKVTDEQGAMTTCTTTAIVNAFPLCDAGPTPSGNVGDTFTFDGSNTTDPDGDDSLIQYDWTFGDGTPTETDAGAMPSHVYAAAGIYTVTLEVTDEQGAMATCAITAVVNQAPVCDIGPTQMGSVGESLTFDASGSMDPDGMIVTYDWNFGDGGPPLVNAGAMPSHTYMVAGTYTVTLKVTDDDGAFSFCTTAAIVNDPPLCDAGPSQSGEPGDTLTFDGSNTTDPDGSVVQYDWDYGDDTPPDLDAGAMPSHVFMASGTYTVTLTVTDDQGAVATCTTTAEVNEAPVCDIGPTQMGSVGESLTFDASGSMDPDGMIVTYDWNFGDGGPPLVNAGAMPSHAYMLAGTYTVTLKVTDDDGAFSFCTTAAIVNDPPLCDAGPSQSGNAGDTLTFDGSNTTDPDGSVVQYDWDYGDDTPPDLDAGAMPSHAFMASGTYTVTLTVTDDQGAMATCTTTAEVNALPLCDAGEDQFVQLGDLVEFDASGSSDPDGTVVQYDWTFGDGTDTMLDLGPTPTYSFEEPGDYVVRLRVTDDKGAVSRCKLLVSVNGPPVCNAGGPLLGEVEELLTFDGTGSFDPDGTIVQYDWNFGDGATAPGAGATPSHAYVEPGIYTVVLTITDDDGAMTTCSTQVSIGDS